MNRVNIRRFPSLGYACDEAVNTLCTNLSFTGENMKKIMVTSCHSAEGKTFIAMNMMRKLAKLGKTVVLVDADLRRSRISYKYGLQFEQDHPTGLSHYLAGMAHEENVLYSTNIKGAYMVPAGREVVNSLQLLVSPRLDKLLDSLAEKVDYVIVDAPPVGTIIDAAEIARSCDGTLVVVGYDSVHRQELIGIKEQLEQTECPILGVVLNQVKFDNYLSRKYYYKSYYSYGYYSYDNARTPRHGKKVSPGEKRKQ